ncbi:DNA excision repair protein ERCC-6-like isoform X1 [Hydra vulgaris]|uniref:DNA excision repair protein ERCC-6-like isoform X1 n=1 Tax=Hydra vulgaris TaxID=6087 RepID=UPI001F5EF34B|nr:DNA excision repair protein ERCC-6-like isoform X1 [Hydra vulgaris]
MDLSLEVEILSKKAKDEAYAGNIKQSLELFKKAYKLLPSEKLKRRIVKLKELMLNMENSSHDENQEGDSDMIDLGENFLLHQSIANQLYSYQKEGVLWFWKLYKKKKGGILGDDMGLGKTIQVIAFLAGMFDAELIHKILIVAPVAVLVNWEKELHKWAPGIRVKTFHGSTKLSRLRNLQKVQQSDGVLLTTYGMIVSNYESFGRDQNGEEFVWDYIILDEGHKIKNPCKTSKCVRMVPAKYQYILTGTPVQNNLSELWALFDYTQKGTLLGTEKTFKMEFENPIIKAREKGATPYQQDYGNQLSIKLREIIAPFFLRRTKDEIFSKNIVQQKETEKNLNRLKSKKYDLVVWVYLSELQQKLYHGFIQSERVKQTLMSTRSPLAELQLLKKISDHPRLQSTLSKLLTGSEEHETRLILGINDETEDDLDEEENKVNERVDDLSVESLIKDSGKMVFLVYLMDNLKAENHRTVIFSQSIKMLDIIQKVLSELGHLILRVDGRMKNPQDRENVLDKFKEDLRYNVLLMTTQIGSVGITLTCANRLVIFDPSWNPGTDAQAVDRVYRIGQEKDVVVYRLVTCGSVEEKIYRKQIFKNAIMKQTTGASDNPYRYFTNLELRELFSLDNPRVSTTQIQLQEMHPYRKVSESIEFERHLQFLNNSCIFGISHHDMLFSQEANNDNIDHEIDIQAKVLSAINLISREYNESKIKLPQKKNRNNETSNNYLSNLTSTTNSDDHATKEFSDGNLLTDHLADTSNHLQKSVSGSSTLSSSDEIDDIMSNIKKMNIKTDEEIASEELSQDGKITTLEPVDVTINEHQHSQHSFQKNGSLNEDDLLQKDGKLHHDESLHKDKHLQDNGNLQEDGDLQKDKTLQNNKSLKEDRGLQDEGCLLQNKSFHKNKSLQENLNCSKFNNQNHVVGTQHLGEDVDNCSLYEAVDIGCDPLSEASLNSSIIDFKIKKDGDDNNLMGNASEEMFSLNDSQAIYNGISSDCNHILVPEVSLTVRNLGKLYRTPPVSPMVKKTLLDLSIDTDFKNFNDFTSTNKSRIKEEPLIKHTINKNFNKGGQTTSTPISDQKLNKLVDVSMQESHKSFIKNDFFDAELNNGKNDSSENNVFSLRLNDITPEKTCLLEKETLFCSNITSSQNFNIESKIKSKEDYTECSKVTDSNVNIHLNSYDLDFLEYGVSGKRTNNIENRKKEANIKSIPENNHMTLLDFFSDNAESLAINNQKNTLPLNMQYADTLPINKPGVEQNDPLLSLNTLFMPDKLSNKVTKLQLADTLPVALNTESHVIDVSNPESHEKSNKLHYSIFVEKSSENQMDFSPSPNYLASDNSSSFDFHRSKVAFSAEKTKSIIEDSESNDAATCQNTIEVSMHENKDVKICEEKESTEKDSKLALLKKLCLENMGNLDIDDHVLIKIAQLAKDLKLVDVTK